MRKVRPWLLPLLLLSLNAQAGAPVIWDAACSSGIYNLALQACLTSGSSGVSSVTASAPLSSSGGATPNISTTTGSLTTSTTGVTVVGTNAGFVPMTVDVQTSSNAQPGLLSAADHTTFAAKQAAGNYITALTGDGTASGPGSSALTFATVNGNVGSFGSATAASTFTVNGKGLLTAAGSTPIQITESQVTSLVSDLAAKQATGNYVTALTSDVTATGPGSVAATIATGAVTDAKGSLATKPAVAVVATSNLTLSGLQTIDGVSVAANTLVLLTAQSTGAENGPWQAQVGAWTRPTWYPTGGTSQAFQFITCFVRLGTTYQGSVWRQTAAAPITIDTTATTWAVSPLALNSNTVSGTLPAAQLPALSGDVTTSAGSAVTTIAANAVTNAKAAQMATNTIKSNVTGGTADPVDNTFATLAATAGTISTNANAKGTANTFALSDHTHQITAGAATANGVPQYDGSNWQAVFPESLFSPRTALYFYDEFMNGNSSATNSKTGDMGWLSTVSGTGASVVSSVTAANNRPGIIQFGSGSTTSGVANISGGVSGTGNGTILLGGGAITVEMAVQVPTLGTAGQQFEYTIGLGDTVNTEPANGVYFRYANGATGDFWAIKTAAGGSRTSTTTATAVVAGQWYRLGFVINAAATSIAYTVDGASVGTITTNIPTLTVAPHAEIVKSAGTTQRTTLLDYFIMTQRFTTSR